MKQVSFDAKPDHLRPAWAALIEVLATAVLSHLQSRVISADSGPKKSLRFLEDPVGSTIPKSVYAPHQAG